MLKYIVVVEYSLQDVTLEAKMGKAVVQEGVRERVVARGQAEA